MLGRRRLVISSVAASLLLALASGASACFVPVGFTWYSDGTPAKSGPAGTVISAYATLTRPNQLFHLASADPTSGDDLPCRVGTMRINPNARTSSSSGLIGLTSGPVNRPIGQWSICFVEDSGVSATIPVSFTVV